MPKVGRHDVGLDLSHGPRQPSRERLSPRVRSKESYPKIPGLPYSVLAFARPESLTDNDCTFDSPGPRVELDPPIFRRTNQTGPQSMFQL